MKIYELILPLSPSVNHYYVRNRGGGVRISDAGQAFRWEVLQAVKRSKMPTLEGRLWMVVRVCPSSKRVQDIANREKALSDALQVAGAFVNDEQIDDIQLKRGPIVKGGRLEVMLGEIDAVKE
jgi:crossover junction endodeoxyribonuclease RusA